MLCPALSRPAAPCRPSAITTDPIDDADPDIPILKEAKAEYSKLR
jgi:hypothetical protein